MRKKGLIVIVALAFGFMLASCGGGSSGGGGGSTTVTKLSSMPSLDLSSYDYSSSGGSAAISIKAEEGGEDGNASRAGCEVNAQKENAIRESKMAQLSRCYPEAMEAGGLITIPSGSYAYYKISVPEEVEDGGGEGPSSIIVKEEGPRKGSPRGGTMYMRLGKFSDDKELRIDNCMGATADATPSQVHSATYTMNGANYIVEVSHGQTFGDHTFSGGMTLTFSGVAVEDGVATLGDTGQVIMDGTFVDDFGRGLMHFEGFAKEQYNVVGGVFQASFEDTFLGGSQDFLSKVYSQFGGTSAQRTGTAKFYFNGSFPAFPLSMMVPEGMPDDMQDEFFNMMSVELGTEITADNYENIYTCPDPECEGSEMCHMVLADEGGVCDQEMTHIESFSISGTPSNLVFAIIENADSAYFDVVNEYDLAELTAPEAGTTVPFEREWNCEPQGDWQTINVREVMASASKAITIAQLTAMREKMETCVSIEQEMNTTNGMEGYRCQEESAAGDVEESSGCEGGECNPNPWEVVECIPTNEGGEGPLADLWEANPVWGEGGPVLQGNFGAVYTDFVGLCEDCKGGTGEEGECNILLNILKGEVYE